MVTGDTQPHEAPMLRTLVLLLLAAPAGAETRCGWYHHNSSTNLYLEDADGSG
jgi:hypothetical protein